MELYTFILYNNNIMTKKKLIVTPENVKPEVRHCNYFQLAKHFSWGPRTITDYELIYVVAGEYLYIDMDHNTRYNLHESEVLCIRPGIRHLLKCTRIPVYGAIISCIHLDLLKGKSRLKREYQPLKEPPVITSLKKDYVIHQLFRNCAKTREGISCFREALLENIGREIWLRLAEYWEGGNETVYSPRIRNMISFIESEIPGNVTRKDLAKKFGLTPEHINAIFKKETGMTPTNFVHRARINLACRYLLEEGLSIKETAERVGFNDEFYFSKVFKKVMNITPGRLY